MNLTINDLQARYSLNSKQSAIAILKEHYEELNANGEYVKCTKGNWSISSDVLSTIDQFMGFSPKKEITPAEIDELTKRAQEAETTLAQVIAENDALKESLHNTRVEADQYAAESRDLQSKYLAMQEGAESDRAAMVRKASLRAEKAESELNRYREKYEHLVTASDEQVKSLTARIEDLMNQLASNHGVMEQKVKADFEAMRARKESERLYDEIHEKEQRLTDLNLNIRELEENKADAQNQLKSIKLQISSALKTVNSLEEQLQSCLDIDDCDTPNTIMEKETAPNVDNTLTESTAPTGITPQDLKRQQLMDDMRDKQSNESSHRKTFWNRVASFF